MSRDLYIKTQASASTDWARPSDWLPMPTGITSADETFVGLHAVFPEGQNYCAFRFITSAGQYEVDWGDGTIDLVNSNVTAEHEYNYAAVSNSTLTSRGYKQSMITVTPVSGNLLACNFQQRFVTSPVQNQTYSTGFLDCVLSLPNAVSGSSIAFGGTTTIVHRLVERVNALTIGNCTSLQNAFNGCVSLQSVPLFNTGNVTNMSSMFFNCVSLKSVPLFNTGNVTNMQQMLQSCVSLSSVPLFDTANVTNMSFMFFSCSSLKSIPALSIASITTTSGTDFNVLYATNCFSLTRCEMVFSRTVGLEQCQLSKSALVEIFNNLVDRTATTSATITITGNWGASALTTAERAIATSKNWVIVG